MKVLKKTNMINIDIDVLILSQLSLAKGGVTPRTSGQFMAGQTRHCFTHKPNTHCTVDAGIKCVGNVFAS